MGGENIWNLKNLDIEAEPGGSKRIHGIDLGLHFAPTTTDWVVFLFVSSGN